MIKDSKPERLLEVGIERSYELIRAFRDNYNVELKQKDAELKKEWLQKMEDWQAFADAGAKGLPDMPKYKSIYKRDCFKATYLQAAFVILNRTREHINHIRQFHRPYFPLLLTRNQLAAQRGGLSIDTISRHLDYLQNLNIIDRKYRGYTHPQEIRMNPAFLAARLNPEACLKIVENTTFIVENTVKKHLSGELPYLAYTPLISFPIIAKCDNVNDCLSDLQYKEQHIIGVLPQMQEEGQNGLVDIGLNTERQITSHPPTPPPSPITKTTANKHANAYTAEYLKAQSEQALQDTLNSYVRLVLRSFLTILYPDYTLHDPERQELTRIFRTMFLNSDGSPMDRQRMGKKYTELMMRFYKVYGWKFRQPNRYLARPSTYLNPDLPHGFKNTEQWLIDDRKKEAENPDWNKNTKLMVALVRKYQHNPDLITYMSGYRELERKKTPKLLELYSLSILDPAHLNHDTVSAAYKNQVTN